MRQWRSYVATGLPEVPDGTTRRLFLLTTAAVATGIGMMASPPEVLAQQSATTALDDADFLLLSKAAVGHDGLVVVRHRRRCSTPRKPSVCMRPC
jgi:hypothetical protein